MITACLLSWKRKRNIPLIVDSLIKEDLISEIILFQNESNGAVVDERIDKQIDFPENMFVYGRYHAAARASNETVFFQDDDLIVKNIGELYEIHSESGVIAANLAQDKSSKHWNWWQVHHPPYVEVGFGSVASRESIKILGDWPYDQGLLRRKADKIFTMMNPWRAVYADGEKIERLFFEGEECGRDKNALYLREDHEMLTGEAVSLTERWKKSRTG